MSDARASYTAEDNGRAGNGCAPIAVGAGDGPSRSCGGPEPLRVLVGFEFSGTVRRAFRERGHEAWSCDLLPAEDGGEHIQGDAREVMRWGCWDLAVLHPPCTRLANSGVRWLAERGLWAELDEACALFRACLDAPIPRVCVENPVMHRHAVERIGRRHDQTVQPWQFGEGETKRTCFWLKGLPRLRPTDIVEGREARVHRMPPGPDRARERSRFFPGIASAMADQFGRFVMEHQND